MLIEFRVENHRSLKTEQVLTMEAGRVDGDATVPRTVPGYSKPLLPVAALYGANASGKSNVLSALAFMCSAVVDSHAGWKPNDGVPRDNFAWDSGPMTPSMFEVTFIQEGTRYRYGFAVSDAGVEEEWLHAWPKGKQQTWFERDKQTLTFGDHLKGERRLIQEVTRYNSLFLSTAAQNNHAQLSLIASWFGHLSTVGVDYQDDGLSGDEVFAIALALSGYRKENPRPNGVDSPLDPFIHFMSDFLAKADVGVTNVKLAATKTQQSQSHAELPRFMLKHQSTSEHSWLPLERESKGTKTMFQFGHPLWQSLRTGGVLLVDELEASLHPKLAIEIIKQFNDPKTNPKNAQLIFTTHDTNLLGNDAGEPVLRRDQVWLTEKDKEGATTLYPLTDFKPRKAENVERGYLQGRYGAIPYLGNFSLLGKDAT